MSRRSSFRDPVGLVRRMLQSGSPAARSALLRAAVAPAFAPLDLALRRREQEMIDVAPPSDQPMLLVVGGPRAGTTVAYEVLVRTLPVSYLTNVTDLLPRSTLAGHRLLARRIRSHDRRAVGLDSYYGQTRGFFGPNDGFPVWDRWLGSERYRVAETVDPDARRSMRRYFDAWRNLFPDPFVNKNNRNADCVALLAEALPEARFLVVRRDPYETVESLVTARAVVQGDARHGWGLRSRDAESHDIGAVVDAVCDQIVEVERRLAAQLATLDEGRAHETTHEALCKEPDAVVSRAAELLGVQPIHSESPLPHRSRSRRLAPHLEERARVRLGELGSD
jgi:hypothetical protein